MTDDPTPPAPLEQSVFRSLFSAYPDALLLVDHGGLIVMANEAASRVLGYEVDELAGMPVEALVPDSIRPRHSAYRDAYARAPRPRPMGTHMELAARRKDGVEVMVEIALSPLQGHGAPLVVAAIRDIGAYPRVLQALQRARYAEHLALLGRLAVDTREPQAVLEQVPTIAREALELDLSLVYLLDAQRLEFRVVSGAGPLAADQVGEVLPNRPDTLPGLVLAQAGIVRVASLGDETRFQVSQRLAAARMVSALAVPMFDRGRVIGVLAAMSSQPERLGDDEVRFLESLANLLASSLQRAQTEEDLNHAQRLETVGQLTGGIAHDFNNLLTVIQGNLQVLEELPELEASEQGRQLVDAATRATRRAAELTGKLLAFARRQVLQPSSVRVGAMLQSLADMLRRTVGQHIRIEVEAADSELTVMADPGQLESALLNIAINARDAMPQGGLLRFEARAEARSHAQLQAVDSDASTDAAPQGYVAITVSDTGSGMSDEVRERAFEPFFTTKAPGRGTGLGLSTVYGFVKQSRGLIEISSAPDKGTRISLLLPRPVLAAPSVALAVGAGAGLRTGLRVLLVEDDAEVRAVMQRFLQTLGCAVQVAPSAEHALALVDAGGDMDLLLTDIALGAGMRGTALAAEMQRRRPAVRVLLMSGFSAELLEADRDSPSHWELLPKPCTRQDLAAAIGRVMARPASS
ncbi:MAG: PAS domain S-box protein [Vitreoscilla sp.]